jgi:neurofibromin 1
LIVSQRFVPTLFSSYGAGLLLIDLKTQSADSSRNPRSRILLQSQTYIAELLADCCTAQWNRLVDQSSQSKHLNDGRDNGASHLSTTSNATTLTPKSMFSANQRGSWKERLGEEYRGQIAPASLDDSQVRYLLDVLTRIIRDDIHSSSALRQNNAAENLALLSNSRKSSEMERFTYVVIEYLSASNWALVFNYIQMKLRNLRIPSANGTGSTNGLPSMTESEADSLCGLQVLARLWINARKLGLLIQEIYGCFLHLRKGAQNVIATLLPDTIIEWIDNFPNEFKASHTSQKRLEGGADLLFEMSNSMADNLKRKGTLWRFQASLLLLIPDAFWAVGNRETKGGSIAKKGAFLETLRKNLKSPRSRDAAAPCLVSICRAARHVPLDSDTALSSYVFDIMNDLCEEVFRKPQYVDDIMIDTSVMIECTVSLCDLGMNLVLEKIVPRCLSAGSPVQFKIALFTACGIVSQQSNADDYKVLYDAVATDMRQLVLDISTARSQAKKQGTNGASNPRANQQYGDIRNSSELLHAMLEFIAGRPAMMFQDSTDDQTEFARVFEKALQALSVCLVDEDEKTRALASKISRKHLEFESLVLLQKGRDRGSSDGEAEFWKATSLVLSTLSWRLQDLDLQELRVRTIIEFIHDYLTSRNRVLRSMTELTTSMDLWSEIPERNVATGNMETTFLLLLCSSDLDICAMVTTSIGLLCDECTLTENLEDPISSNMSIVRNWEVYKELSSQNFRLTGQVAFQKRIRKLLSHIGRPTPGILNAWEAVFVRWVGICNHILSLQFGVSSASDDKALMEWRNYSGFLASLGGACIAENTEDAAVDDPMLAGLRWIDRLAADGVSSLERFMHLCLQLLTASNLVVREATREVLATELSPRLYLQLLQSLESELAVILDGSSESHTFETRVIFAEQMASLLRTIVDRLEDSLDMFFTFDFGSLVLSLVRYANSLKDDAVVLRVKIKMSQLCEVVARKKDILNLRHDIRVRNHLAHILFEWTARPGTPKIDNTILGSGARRDELFRLQKDLDRACLKALVHLMYRLPLQQPIEGSDTDISDSKSHLFNAYFNGFISLLSNETTDLERRKDASALAREEHSSTLELLITALSNLLSANVDVGLKHSLQIGYHSDPEIRTAFMNVLSNILTQGTEFGSLGDSTISEKYDRLLELLVGDLDFTIALCDSCPSTEVDEMTIVLLNIFDSRGMGMDLLKALIENEVNNTENESELLRRNCVATKMLSIYAKWKGSAYLKSTLQKVLERLLVSSEHLDLELDPARTSSPEELNRNALQLRYITKVFIDDITKSADKVPISFQRLCYTISSAVTKRFPEAKFTAVGSFIFLRFFCPAIVAPDSEGLVNTIPTKAMRRGLMLIAKVIQNLANNVLFGAKEQYMFSLNDFLTSNIYQVTTFLRKISAPPSIDEPSALPDSFDYGSTVALHRFLYDHWETVRQKLIVQDRRARKGTAANSTESGTTIKRATSLLSFNELVPILGPPPTDISWSKPQISSNIAPAFSRFQQFMLKNAGRNTESIISARALYDGGESKDGIPVICMVLRNIDAETVDKDLLVYCFLKIASRMWHRPFGTLIDATSFNQANDVLEDFNNRMNHLTPTDLVKNMSRCYVYNMNSSFRKSFRRSLRQQAKLENSPFNPNIIDFFLIGSLQELQTHFHLGSLHLPRDTISVVTDSRYIFQPVTRLSKTKGRIDVVVKIGSQFVQITTTKKQEIVPGLRLNATVNDIFRLTDVEEASTSMQAEDDNAFGIKTENGKVVMYFTSPRKMDILQAIRAAKTKPSTDARPSRAVERTIRPEDVPGMMLNISLTNIASSDEALRLASYNLLCALCTSFGFTLGKHFVATNGHSIPANSISLVVGVSEKLAASEPQLTYDFLTEFFIGWDRAPQAQRSLNVLYMAPWLGNLRLHILSSDTDSEKARERIAQIARKLIDIAIQETTLYSMFQQNVWPVVAKDEVLIDIFLEEMVKNALSAGFASDRTEIIGSIAGALNTVAVRGRLIAKLRKALNKTSQRSTRHLVDNVAWNEICVLLRICLAISFDSRVQAQLFLPELFHIITMVVSSGSTAVRSAVHKLLVNTVHSMCTSFPLSSDNLLKLKKILASLSETKMYLLFGLPNTTSRDVIYGRDQRTDNATFTSMETIANLLLEVINVAAPSIDIANQWRSRWMSLVASTAFQNNPAIQPRAFAVMGCLARDDVDDDLLYQVLVALRSGIIRFADNDDSDMLVAIITSLTKMMDKLPTTSRYVLQLFWLAMALVRFAPPILFACTASFLEAVLHVIAASGEFKEGRMIPVLLQGRLPVEDAASEIDELYGIRFEYENFHFASSLCLAKGLSDSMNSAVAVRTITTFLEVARVNSPDSQRFPKDITIAPYLGLLGSRATTLEESKDLVWQTGSVTTLADVEAAGDVFSMLDMDSMRDKELLLQTALCLIDFRSCEDTTQQQILKLIERVAKTRPQVLLHLYQPVISILDSILASSQNPGTLRAAHSLVSTISADHRFSDASQSEELLENVLEEIGFSGLWTSSTFKMTKDYEKRCAVLTDKLIEVCITYH